MTLVTKCYHVHYVQVPIMNHWITNKILKYSPRLLLKPLQLIQRYAKKHMATYTHIFTHITMFVSVDFSNLLAYLLSQCTVHYQVFPGLYFCTQQNMLTIPLTWYTQLPNKQTKKTTTTKKTLFMQLIVTLAFFWLASQLYWLNVNTQEKQQSIRMYTLTQVLWRQIIIGGTLSFE